MSSLDIPSWPNPSGESLQTNHTTWISEVPDPRLVHEVDKVFGIRDILQSLLLSKIATSTHWVAFFFQALVTSHIVSHLLFLEGIQLLSSCLKQIYQRKHWTVKTHRSEFSVVEKSNRENANEQMNARCVLRLLRCSKHGTSWHDSIPSLSPSFHLCLPNPSFTSYFTYFSLDLQSQKRMSCHLHLVHSLQHTICRFLAFFSKVTSFVRISHLDISFHLFTSVTTGSSHIAALPKPISGVPPNQDQASEK